MASNFLCDTKSALFSAKESQLADNAINKLFEEYKDKNEDLILTEGVVSDSDTPRGLLADSDQ
jgi:hypothetical protein